MYYVTSQCLKDKIGGTWREYKEHQVEMGESIAAWTSAKKNMKLK
jgi:hypothetical protein